MNRGPLLILLGTGLIALGLVERGWLLLSAWLGADCLILGIAHSQSGHRVFGKRADGTLPFWSWLLFFPLITYTTALWHLLRLASRAPSHNTVTDDLVIGRRLLPSELAGEFANYVDLTAEFQEPAAIRTLPCYRSFPILDGSAPSPQALRAAVKGLPPGRTFVHCAQGRGRTALFALAILLGSGQARTAEEGWRRLKSARPGIRLNREQQACLRLFSEPPP